MASPTRNDAELLCERCGYSVEGLPTEGPCPECGQPIAESLPAKRTGSPWQRGPSFQSFARTLFLAVFHPFRIWRTLRVEWYESWRLLIRVLLLAAMLHGMGLMARWRLGDWTRAGDGPTSDLSSWLPFILLGVLVDVVSGLMLAIPLFIPLFLLTMIELAGLRIIGRVHRYRIGKTAATTVCAHAASGWVVGGVFVYLAAWTAFVVEHYVSFQSNWLADAVRAAVEYLPLLAFAAGLLWFETLCWLGVRRLRYANRPIRIA